MADRIVCQHCRRPPVVCFCAHVKPLPTRTRLLLLQHPKERKVGVGTARIAHLSLPNSLLRVGLDFGDDPLVQGALSASGPVCVLFPRPGALDVAELPRDRAITLVVLDGTWSLARKLLRVNPALAALPHVAFSPRRPSEYRIRRQPAEMCLSTIEALAEVLDIIEPDNGPFDRLLDPFRAMVSRQERFVSEVGAYRHRRPVRPQRPSRRAVLAARLSQDWERLVCVQGDSNAWPRRHPDRQRPEIVHWVAHRPATGETFEAVVAPRRPLAPGTAAQTELTAERLGRGGDVAEWRDAWRAFSRSDDIAVSWGTFYVGLAAEDGLFGVATAAARDVAGGGGREGREDREGGAGREGGARTAEWTASGHALDLRREALEMLRADARRGARSEFGQGAGPRGVGSGRLRTVDECAAILGAIPPALALEGRAGRRLAALSGVLATLRGQARGRSAGGQSLELRPAGV